jgi:hypothetical protein
LPSKKKFTKNFLVSHLNNIGNFLGKISKIFNQKIGEIIKKSFKKRKKISVKIPRFLKRGNNLNNFTTSMGLYK